MKVDINELRKALNYISTINNANLKDIVWMDGDKQVNPSQLALDQYKFTGLANKDFLEFYLELFIKPSWADASPNANTLAQCDYDDLSSNHYKGMWCWMTGTTTEDKPGYFINYEARPIKQ